MDTLIIDSSATTHMVDSLIVLRSSDPEPTLATMALAIEWLHTDPLTARAHLFQAHQISLFCSTGIIPASCRVASGEKHTGMEVAVIRLHHI